MSLSLAGSLFAAASLPPTRLFSNLSPPSKQPRQTQREQDVPQGEQQHPPRSPQGLNESLTVQTIPPPLALRSVKPPQPRITASAASRAAKRKALSSNPASTQLSLQQQHTLQKLRAHVERAHVERQHHADDISYHANAAVIPSHVRLFLIGKLAADTTIETFMRAQDQWCADCLKKELAAARKDKQKDSTGRSASVKETGAETLSAAAASPAAASAPPAAKTIHVGPRMHDGSRVWPPLGWSPKQSSAGLSWASKEECTEVPEEGSARLVSRFSSKGFGSSGDLELQLETQPAHNWSAIYGPVQRVFDMGYGLSAADDRLSEELCCKAGRWRAAARYYSSERIRYTFSSTAVPTSAISSPGCCSRFSSEKSLSLAMGGGAEQHRQKSQQKCSSRLLGAGTLPMKEPESSRGKEHSSGENGKAGALLTKLAAIGHRIRRASVNALRGSLLGPYPPADSPCRREPAELVEAQASS
ncbi:hypothetical protein Esti_003971 [Eimeria stiedai]